MTENTLVTNYTFFSILFLEYICPSMDDGKVLARYDNANGLHWCNLSDVLTCLISDTFSNKNGKNWLSFAAFTFSYDFLLVL